jgi:hypothetical protein
LQGVTLPQKVMAIALAGGFSLILVILPTLG